MITRKARKALRNKRRNSASALANDPYFVGDAARHEGKPASANPHPIGSTEAADWLQGWQESIAAQPPAECDTCEIYGECVCIED